MPNDMDTLIPIEKYPKFMVVCNDQTKFMDHEVCSGLRTDSPKFCGYTLPNASIRYEERC